MNAGAQYRYTVTKRTVEDNTVIAYIDLLGTRRLYTGSPIEDQAVKIFEVLLSEFEIKFREHFKESGAHFDISIYADSIVICQRLTAESFSRRIVDFLLSYQSDLLINNGMPSRAIVVKESLFSLKLDGASESSILSSKYTNISLCGGKGIIEADSKLKGLPIGVYITEEVRQELSKDQNNMMVPVTGEPLYFVKQNINGVDMCFLPDETIDLILNSASVTDSEIRVSLKNNGFEDDNAYDKWVPWILVHMGRQSEILRK